VSALGLQGIVAARSPEEIVQPVLQGVRRLITCTRVNVSLFDMDALEYKIFALETDADTVLFTGLSQPFVRNNRIEQLEAGQVIMVPNLQLYENAASPAAIKQLIKEGIQSAIHVPLIAQGQLIGVLSLLDISPDYFTDEHQEIAGEVAAQLAIAIHQNRLNEQIQRHADELEERVAQRTAQLETANKELEAFAYSVSHDLRTPLRSINGFSQILLKDYEEKLDAVGVRYLHNVSSSAVRMGELIDDLLHLSRVSRVEMHYKMVDLSAIAHAIIAELREITPDRLVEIHITPNLIAKGDTTLLRVVMQNLLENAWKYTSHHDLAYIEFGTEEIDGVEVFFVRDNGAGFNMAYSQNLFGAFQRLHREDEFPGTGIGLATVQRIIHRHGGIIWGDAVVEEGATFYFVL